MNISPNGLATGGATISDYVITYRSSKSGKYKTFSDGVETASTARVTGLTAGRTYYFVVTAKTEFGTGTASSKIKVITPRA